MQRSALLALLGTLLVAALVIAAAITAAWWTPPLLAFVGANTDLIQGVTDLVQLLLWVIGLLLLMVGWWRSGWRPGRSPTPERGAGTAAVTGSGPVAQGGSKAAGSRGVVAEKIEGSVNTGDQPRQYVVEHYHDYSAQMHTPPVAETAAPTDPTIMRRNYLSALSRQVGTLPLAGVDRKAASEAETRLHLGAVYTALLSQGSDEPEGMPEDKGPGRGDYRHSALDRMNRHARLVLLGDPGSGKSTFVNYVALCLAGEALGYTQANLALLTAPLPKEERDDQERSQHWEHGPLLPVRVVLRDFAARGLPAADKSVTADHLWRFIAAELAAVGLDAYAAHMRRELEQVGGLLLLDGLDEAPEANQRRTQIHQAVTDFAAVFPRCRILITCRTYAYQKQGWRLVGFAETVLAPFSPGQVGRFVDRWYAHIGELRSWHVDDTRGRAELLKQAILARERLRELAERPLLLTLIWPAYMPGAEAACRSDGKNFMQMQWIFSLNGGKTSVSCGTARVRCCSCSPVWLNT